MSDYCGKTLLALDYNANEGLSQIACLTSTFFQNLSSHCKTLHCNFIFFLQELQSELY